MRMLLVITALFFVIAARGQNTETDSLKKLLTSTNEDSKRIKVLEGLSYAYLSSYPDTALQYALEGLQLAKNTNDLNGEALCTNALGSVYFHVGDYPKALEMYLRYLKLKENTNNRSAIAVAYFNIASVYTEEGDYGHALYYLFKARQEDIKRKDSSGILFDLYSLGSVYVRMHKQDSALYYINQSYQLAQKLQDKNMMGAILNTFGETYASLNNNALAAEYYYRSIPFVLAIKDNEVLSSTYYGLAKIFEGRNLLDSAIYYARKALHISREAPFLKQVLETSTFLTNLFKTKKRFDSAFYYQELSIATKDSLFNVENVKKVQNLKFQEQQRQQAIKTANTEYRNKIKFYIVIFSSGIFLIIAIVLWRNNKQKQKAYEELKATQAQLIQSEKMASLGELTAGIAHEIQNPLNFVNNFSDLSKELLEEMRAELSTGKYPDAMVIADDVKRNLDKILHHGKRADSIVKGMLHHSRSSTGIKEPTDINVLADEYLRLSYHGLRAKDKSLPAGHAGFNATIKTDFDETIEKINIVPQDIGRVMLNLFNYAFYAVAQKKKQQDGNYEPMVSVSTRKQIDKPDSHRVIIRVKDNGNGIPQKVIDKIFQPFFTTKPTGQGTGLGLSISYDIIKTHGGEIRVEAKEGEGSEFIITL